MTLSELLDAEERELARKRDAYRWVEYTGDDCNNPRCGRQRVGRVANGKRICDKCYWDQDALRYEGTYADLHT